MDVKRISWSSQIGIVWNVSQEVVVVSVVTELVPGIRGKATLCYLGNNSSENIR